PSSISDQAGWAHRPPPPHPPPRRVSLAHGHARGGCLRRLRPKPPVGPPPPDSAQTAAPLDTLEERTFHYVWSLANTSSLWMAVMEDQVPRRARRSGDPASNQHLTSGVPDVRRSASSDASGVTPRRG